MTNVLNFVHEPPPYVRPLHRDVSGVELGKYGLLKPDYPFGSSCTIHSFFVLAHITTPRAFGLPIILSSIDFADKRGQTWEQFFKLALVWVTRHTKFVGRNQGFVSWRVHFWTCLVDESHQDVPEDWFGRE